MSLTTISRVFDTLLIPVAPFTWVDLPVSTLDLLAILRLCAVMRQLREASNVASAGVEDASFMRDYMATFTVVFGGEAIANMLVGVPPSFVSSPFGILLYLGGQFIVDSMPYFPAMSFPTEGPLTTLDAFTRSYLVCSLVPPVVLAHSNPSIAQNPWTLLLSSFITANGGFFIVNLFSMINPTGWSLTTPAELRTYGWTTVDLWAAPLATGIYALLTHAQPFWASLHLTILQFAQQGSGASDGIVEAKPWLASDARAVCMLMLWSLFGVRAVNNFGVSWWNSKPERKRVMRSRIDGRRHPSTSKVKIQ